MLMLKDIKLSLKIDTARFHLEIRAVTNFQKKLYAYISSDRCLYIQSSCTTQHSIFHKYLECEVVHQS